jgi:hypothetical protein
MEASPLGSATHCPYYAEPPPLGFHLAARRRAFLPWSVSRPSPRASLVGVRARVGLVAFALRHGAA